MTRYQIIHNDILEWVRGYEGEPFHAMLLDAPYHLTIAGRFGKPESAPAKGDVYRRASKGFMGQIWDGGDIAFRPETWAALATHLYPGAFGMSFAGSRGWHRMAVAIEDAGLIIHPSIFGWTYLSGFPKATRIKGYGSPAFTGHRYGLQALKPALEPIVVFQKPYEGRPVDSIVKTGAGALNIDGSRIPTGEDLTRDGYGLASANHEGWKRPWNEKAEKKEWGSTNGRWPSNFLLQHSPLCNGQCVEDCPVAMLDRQSGNLKSGELKGQYKGTSSNTPVYGEYGYSEKNFESNEGPASRIFFQADFSYEVAEQLANAEPVRYEPKVGSNERSLGLEGVVKLRSGLSEEQKRRVLEELERAGVRPLG